MYEIIISILHGIFLAFGLILPLGVQNLFIFNQGSMHSSILGAMPSVITASLCDSLLILFAVFGISLALMENHILKISVLIIGCVFLYYMGFYIWRQSATLKVRVRTPYSWKRQIVFAVSVSLLNPHAIIDTVMVMGTNSLTYEGVAKLTFTFACIIVSWIWFIFLAFAGRNLHKIDSTGNWFKNINRVAAIIVWIIAVGLTMDVVKDILG